MKKAKPSPPLTALSLQGGGALGAYEYGVLKALYAVRGENFVPRVVAGVSIGAINAALLVGARTDAMAALDRLWREKLCVDAAFTPESAPAPAAGENACGIWGTRPGQYLSFFGNPGMYRLKPEYCFMPFCAPFFTSSVYDTSLLKETLAELVDPEKLNRPDKTRLIVTAVDVETGRQAKFDNAETTLTLDHIVASGSFPVSFPPTLIDGRYYWDGGIFMNMPVGVAANALEQIEADNPSAVREIILVSLHRTRGGSARNTARGRRTVLHAALFRQIRAGPQALRQVQCLCGRDAENRRGPARREPHPEARRIPGSDPPPQDGPGHRDRRRGNRRRRIGKRFHPQDPRAPHRGRFQRRHDLLLPEPRMTAAHSTGS